ncbi:hypothetical protein PoB_005540000 [Plakobranchus ocellatus]|uniref:Uncharacterized protein n=1 Tax=Plakobranchus ocellatus TaxID=259542 RepID=A0AAV4CB63_9GAST|nr:hypothetical protein PoB_005540000 [Plakobranchus ocellatus]
MNRRSYAGIKVETQTQMVVEIGNISSSRTNQPAFSAKCDPLLQGSRQCAAPSNLPLSRGLTNQSQGTHSYSNNNFKTGPRINDTKHNYAQIN